MNSTNPNKMKMYLGGLQKSLALHRKQDHLVLSI